MQITVLGNTQTIGLLIFFNPGEWIAISPLKVPRLPEPQDAHCLCSSADTTAGRPILSLPPAISYEDTLKVNSVLSNYENNAKRGNVQDLVREQKQDLAVLDWNMPRLAGTDVARELAAHFQSVICSVQADPEIVELAVQKADRTGASPGQATLDK